MDFSEGFRLQDARLGSRGLDYSCAILLRSTSDDFANDDHPPDGARGMDASRRQLLDHLAQRIQEIEASWRPPGRSPCDSSIPGLAECLPKGGLPVGSLVELLSAREGSGAWTLALLMAREACAEHKALVVTDFEGSFYPPAAARYGINLERLIVVRPTRRRDAAIVAEQSLRCPAVGAAVGWYDELRTLDVRRLQLAAETGGGLGFLLRPAGALRVPSFAALRLLVTPVAAPTRSLRLDVVRCRGGRSGKSVFLEIDDETGDVRLAPAVAAPAARSRAARSSG
jgi:protein ImuA